MSHELLVISGASSGDARATRRRIVEAAALRVPRMTAVKTHDSDHATVGVISTAPLGGDVVDIIEGDGALRATVALTETGAASAATGSGQRDGAEAGHVTVLLRPDGAVELGTDGFATVSLYWAVHDGQLLAATHLASLVSLGLPAQPDRSGILQYLAMLHPLGAVTTLEGASLLEPGGHVTWRPGAPPQVRTAPLFVPRSSHGDDDWTLGEFREVWHDIVADLIERSRDQRVLLGLSGGLDSRAVAAQYVELGTRPLTYTYGTRSNREVVAASRVAERLGLPHVSVPTTDDRLLFNAAEATQLLDGAHAPTEMYELWYEDRLRSMADVVVNGLAGGPLWGDDKLMGLTDATLMADRVWERYAAGASETAALLVPDLARDMVTMVREAIQDSVARWSDVDRADVGIFWRIATRQVRWGNNLMTVLRRAGIRPETPFLDGRFLRFVSGLTPAQRRNGRLYLRVQREVFSETADLARSDDGNSPAVLDHVYWSGDESYAIQLGQLARSHPLSAVRRGIRHAVDVGAEGLRERVGIEGPADFTASRSSVFPADVFARTRPVYANRLAGLLDGGREIPDIFAVDAITSASADLRAGRGAESAVALGKAATLAAWLHDYRERESARLDPIG